MGQIEIIVGGNGSGKTTTLVDKVLQETTAFRAVFAVNKESAFELYDRLSEIPFCLVFHLDTAASSFLNEKGWRQLSEPSLFWAWEVKQHLLEVGHDDDTLSEFFQVVFPHYCQSMSVDYKNSLVGVHQSAGALVTNRNLEMFKVLLESAANAKIFTQELALALIVVSGLQDEFARMFQVRHTPKFSLYLDDAQAAKISHLQFMVYLADKAERVVFTVDTSGTVRSINEDGYSFRSIAEYLLTKGIIPESVWGGNLVTVKMLPERDFRHSREVRRLMSYEAPTDLSHQLSIKGFVSYQEKQDFDWMLEMVNRLHTRSLVTGNGRIKSNEMVLWLHDPGDTYETNCKLSNAGEFSILVSGSRVFSTRNERRLLVKDRESAFKLILNAVPYMAALHLVKAYNLGKLDVRLEKYQQDAINQKAAIALAWAEGAGSFAGMYYQPENLLKASGDHYHFAGERITTARYFIYKVSRWIMRDSIHLIEDNDAKAYGHEASLNGVVEYVADRLFTGFVFDKGEEVQEFLSLALSPSVAHVVRSSATPGTTYFNTVVVLSPHDEDRHNAALPLAKLNFLYVGKQQEQEDELANVLSDLGDDAKTIRSVLQNKSHKEIADLAEKSRLSLDDFLATVPTYLSELELKEVGKWADEDAGAIG